MTTASHAYARTARAGLTGRALEAAVLTRCADKIAQALNLADGAGDPLALTAALDVNRQAWAIFAKALRNDATDLPPDLRASVEVSIGLVFKLTIEILASLDAGIDAARARTLITVNREFAAGLRGEKASQAA